MLRRRLIIEWDDDAVDTDEECAKTFVAGDWTVQDIIKCELNVKVWVEDAPSSAS